MAPVTQRHKRSGARMISPPFPTASSTDVFDGAGEVRKSREAASDGYSSLFTSGFMRQHAERHSTSPSCPSPTSVRGPFHPSIDQSPNKDVTASLLKTPARRRRSSIPQTTPTSGSARHFKAGGADNDVERALDNVMKTLRTISIGTPRLASYPDPPREESRWSSSSEESLAETEDSGFWRSRKSSESTRSRVTIVTMKSARSTKSRKSRKSVDTDRIEIEEVPPVPVAPATPSRRKRIMEGLAKRLGLTPKKKVVEEPVKEPVTPRLPRKSSLSTLRSVIAKKTSTGTLRSVRSAKTFHPFIGAGPTFDCEAYPPLPRWTEGDYGNGCLPTTPRSRTPKSSIGPPRLQPSTSPSQFLKDMPRRAPGTPKDDTPPMPDVLEAYYAPSPAKAVTPSNMFTVSLDDKLQRAAAAVRDATPEMSPGRCDTPRSEGDIATPRSDASIATPRSVVHADSPSVASNTSLGTPALTARAAQEAMKPKRLFNLLPKQSRMNLGIQTPPRTALRQKKSIGPRSVLGDKTNLALNVQGMNNPDSILSVLAKADKRQPVSRFGASAPSPISKPPLASYRHEPGEVKRYEPFSASGHPCRAGSDDRDTPVLRPTEDENSFEATFGQVQANRRSIPDFKASPNASFSGISFTGRISRRGSGASLESDLPTEEWELEAYLKELERVDQERAMMCSVGVVSDGSARIS